MPFDGSKFLIAVSGGADSCALAYALAGLVSAKKLANQFIVAHYNHGLRGIEGDRDTEFVGKFSAELGFPFITDTAGPGEIDPVSNVEQAARNARYRFLFGAASDFDCGGVITAHTINDQAETFLMNLLRGSGITGLSGMDVISSIEPGDQSRGKEMNYDSKSSFLIRPLLSWAKREDTLAYAAENSIRWRPDPMNEDIAFTRVKVRKNLIPAMKGFNPKIIETLARTSELLRDDADVLRECDKNDIAKMCGSDMELTVASMRKLNGPRRNRLLRAWLERCRGTLIRLENVHIEAIADLLESVKSGRLVELPGGERVIKRNGKLIFLSSKVDK